MKQSKATRAQSNQGLARLSCPSKDAPNCPIQLQKVSTAAVVERMGKREKIGTEQKVFLLLLLFFSLCDIILKLESQQKLFVRFLAERKS